jgi:hypothetical protein
MDADMAMLYRTLLQLSADVAEMKSVLRHLLSMSVDLQEPSPTDIRPAVVAPPTDVPVDDLQRCAAPKETVARLQNCSDSASVRCIARSTTTGCCRSAS